MDKACDAIGLAAMADDELDDQKASPDGRLYSRLLRRAYSENAITNEEATKELAFVRTLTDGPKLHASARPLTFARFLTDVLGESMPAMIDGAQFRQHRDYGQGDDLRYVDWKASARSEKMKVRQMEESTTNSLEVVVDTEWLAEESADKGVPPNARYLMVLLSLARKERVPLSVSIRFRGEQLHRFESSEIKELLGRQRLTGHGTANTEAELLKTISNLGVATSSLLKYEKEQGIDDLSSPVFADAPEMPASASVIALLARNTIRPSGAVLGAMERRGAAVRVAKVRHKQGQQP